MTAPGRPLRILVGANVPPDPDSGAAGTVFRTSRALRELGHEVDEIWAEDVGRSIPHGNLHYLLELPRRYRAAVRRRTGAKEYDVVQLSQPAAWMAARDHRRRRRPGVFVNRSHGLEVQSDTVVGAWRRRLGEPANRFPRDLATRVLRPMLHRQTDRVVRWADGLIVGTEEAGELLRASYGVPASRVAVIPHGVPDGYLATPAPDMAPERARRLLYVGQHAFFKAPMILAEALDRLAAERPDLEMTWVCGEEHHDAVRARLGSAARGRVTLLPWMPQEALRAAYDAHGVFLFPSFYEGFGKTPLEAMARGLCVVSSEVGGMRDYVRDGEDGLLVPPGDPGALVGAALRLIDDPGLARRISASARERAEAYTWTRCAREAVTFYRGLLDARAEERGG